MCILLDAEINKYANEPETNLKHLRVVSVFYFSFVSHWRASETKLNCFISCADGLREGPSFSKITLPKLWTEDIFVFCVCVLDSRLRNRHWVYTDSGRMLHRNSSESCQKNGIKFTIASYNVLAQNLLEENSYLYSHCSDFRYLEWSYRQQQLLAEITYYEPDVSWINYFSFLFILLYLRQYQYVASLTTWPGYSLIVWSTGGVVEVMPCWHCDAFEVTSQSVYNCSIVKVHSGLANLINAKSSDFFRQKNWVI